MEAKRRKSAKKSISIEDIELEAQLAREEEREPKVILVKFRQIE